MTVHFRRRLLGPLVFIWAGLTIASLFTSILAWERFSHTHPPGASAGLQQAHFASWAGGLLALGAGLAVVFLSSIKAREEQAHAKLLLEKLEAEASVKEKGVFLANMSHEIRSPMNAILGFSELLEPEGLTPQQSEYVRAIRDSGASLLQTINDILDLSKLEAGRLELRPDPTDMHDSCEFLRTLFAQQAVHKSLQLHFELAADLPRALLLDRLRLRQVLVNLLSNAIKFTERGSIKTTVAWAKDGPSSSQGTLSISVADTGIGIPADKLDEIFTPFFQVGAGSQQGEQGTGIGLTIVKRLAAMMNGTVTVESTQGRGSTFYLQFPGIPVSVRLPVGDHAEPGRSVDFNRFAPATLLVADDNPINRELMVSMFAKTHHRVETVNDGKQVLAWLDSHEADAVLLDLRMPVMGGRETLAAVRKQAALLSLPVIAVTASSPVGDEATLRSNFSGFIRKPFSRHTLFEELSRHLQQMPPPPVDLESEMDLPPGTLNPLPERTGHWRTLSLQLRLLEAGDWHMLSQTMAINEIRALADELRALGNAAQCSLLTVYAANLSSLAANYEITKLELEMAKFPKLIGLIETTPRECSS